MATASKQHGTKIKPVTCGKCKTVNFEYSLSCKRCGDYLENKDVAQESAHTNIGSKIMGAAAVCVAIVAACVVFRIF